MSDTTFEIHKSETSPRQSAWSVGKLLNARSEAFARIRAYAADIANIVAAVEELDAAQHAAGHGTGERQAIVVAGHRLASVLQSETQP